MVAVHDQLTRARVMAVAEDLGAQGATGVLEVRGDPSGALYLDGGRIAFARASWVPGLVDRLRGLRPSSGELQELPAGRDADDTDDTAIAALVVQRGYLTPPALHELIRSIVVDAFLVLTVPLATDSPVAAIRFTSTRTYWTEMFPRLGIDLVREEAYRRAERLAEHGLAPTTAVALCDLRAPAAVLTREQWAVACQIGECASALDLAARRGAALSDTLECLGGLARAGLCAPVHASGVGQPSSRMADPLNAANAVNPVGQPAEPRVQRLPVRYPVQDRAERPGGIGQAPTVDILRQVLNGLKKLS